MTYLKWTSLPESRIFRLTYFLLDNNEFFTVFVVVRVVHITLDRGCRLLLCLYRAILVISSRGQWSLIVFTLSNRAVHAAKWATLMATTWNIFHHLVLSHRFIVITFIVLIIVISLILLLHRWTVSFVGLDRGEALIAGSRTFVHRTIAIISPYGVLLSLFCFLFRLLNLVLIRFWLQIFNFVLIALDLRVWQHKVNLI